MLIRELAQVCSVPAKTIRYYESVGLLPQPQRANNGYRVYGAADVDRLRLIAGARALGFSLDDIREVLAFRERGEAPCRYVLDLMSGEVTRIEQRIADLRRLRNDLRALLDKAHDLPLDDVEGKACVCHLIQNHQRAASSGVAATRQAASSDLLSTIQPAARSVKRRGQKRRRK